MVPEIRSTSGHTAERIPNGSQYAERTTRDKVVVAVRAEKKEMSKTALAWALTHIVRPGDCITLLAVLSDDGKSGRRRWNFPKFGADCASKHRERSPPDQIYQISESCSQMVLQFHDQNQVGVRIKVVSGSPAGVVAAESKKAGANWVVLDKQLKEEEKHCLEELHCNIVVMKRSQAKVLRVNLGSSNDLQPLSSPSIWEFNIEDSLDSTIKHSTPVSSPEDVKTPFTRTTTEDTSISSSDAESSPFFVCEQNPLFEGHKKEKAKPIHEEGNSNDSFKSFDSDVGGGHLIVKPTSSRKCIQGNVYWIPQNHIDKVNKVSPDATSRTLLEKFVQIDQQVKIQPVWLHRTNQMDHVFNSNVRDVVSLNRSSPAPPPLCSLCQNRAPVFGKPPRWFDYRELEEATDRFSKANSLAESGLGSVHRGVLRDGQVVAVKHLNVAGSLGDAEFCREVGILSCAQHRNVVMLIGFCVEGEKRLLVYEYVCNGSLDFHLYGRRRNTLDWDSRVKIAIGTARGLRYLHEDCRVGCIVHRDVRPNNILLTHDFEPQVGDFGVTKWQSEHDLRAEQRNGRALRYLPPENMEDENITEKADIYAFGLVLKELITGRKTAAIALHNKRQFPAEWNHLLLELEQQGQTQVINLKLVDPCLDPDELQCCSHQLQAMASAAFLCLRREPASRPPMSKVLRILEGGKQMVPLALNFDSIGNRSERFTGRSSNQRTILKGKHSRRLSH
ncbi:hypothetical protein IFM89_002814 [Coptis chinensis]|uniref:non-specific serine/threonine protein kinase n=1 Tax=Coptis chinensis TaxID=261450 RepID=A0A835HRJ2_9MAGN|nr:hypothetical protein IFM89_002814 [Coptis chinensis]